MDQAEELRNRVKASGALSQQKEYQPKERQPKEQIPNLNSARVITVTSGKGGVGKTSVSVNLALQFQKMGKKTVIIDADFGLANIEVMLGAHPKYNISDLIYNNMEMEDIITKGPEGVSFISGGSGVNELINLDRADLQVFVSKMTKLDEVADIIIIDTGAGISDAVQEFLLYSPEILIVITPEPTSTMDAYALLKTINRRKEFNANEKKINVITNRVTDDKEGMALFHNISMVSSQFLKINLEYLGAIPQDTCAMKAIVQQRPISISFPNSVAARSLREIADKLCNVSQNKKEGFVGMFLNMLRSQRKR